MYVDTHIGTYIGTYAVVADHRIGKAEELTRVRWIRQRLWVTHHTYASTTNANDARGRVQKWERREGMDGREGGRGGRGGSERWV